MTTSGINWPNIIQKIEIEIELMIWFYENIQNTFQKKKSNFHATVSDCVKISVRKKETFFTAENKISEKYKNFNARVSISSKVTVYTRKYYR